MTSDDKIIAIKSGSILPFLDIDECSTNSHTCDVNAFCNNTSGSYKCSCNPGFFGNGQACFGKNHCHCCRC